LILNNKLAGVADEKLVTRLMEVWTFYFGTVLPYIQGAFLPLQAELRMNPIYPGSVRGVVLNAFRDQIIIPIVDRLQGTLWSLEPCREYLFKLLNIAPVVFDKVMQDTEDRSRRAPDTLPRMLQMLSVLNEMRDTNQVRVGQALKSLKLNMQKYGRSPHRSMSNNELVQ
jgi:hypothetical protein